jgi:putative FmdB family regulatory protein
MPTYHYRCACGHEFEVRQAITDEPLDFCLPEDCPNDERFGDVTRIIGAPGIALRGKGFHATDYPKRGANE